MSEMIERIARKLEPQAWAALGIGDSLAYKNRRTSSLRKARLVLEEMREPDVIAAGAAIIMDQRAEPKSALPIAKEAWEAVIDAILAEPGPLRPAGSADLYGVPRAEE